MAERTPVYELHIKPLFRILDRQHMLRVKADLDLWNYAAVKTFADRILQRVQPPTPSMPTDDTGGAWPSEWVTLFDRWIKGGCRRLLLGVGKDYKLVKSGQDRYTLSCKVDIPNPPDGDSSAWLDVVAPGPVGTTYQLYVYPGEKLPPPADTTEVTCQERIDAANATGGVTVIDAAGSHALQALS